MSAPTALPLVHALAPEPVLAALPGSVRDVIDDYVFEHPLLGAMAVALVTLLTFEVLRRTGKLKWAWWALAAGTALAAAVIALGIAVETPRERLATAARALVEAVVNADTRTAETLLDDRVAFRTDMRLNARLDRDWLLGVVRGMPGVFKSHSLEIREVVLDDPDLGRTRILSRAEFTNEPFGLTPSTWELRWRRKGDRWVLTQVECQTIWGHDANDEWVRWGERHRH